MNQTEKIQIVANLQKICAEAYNSVMSNLWVGTSEADIADELRKIFDAYGIIDHWYDVPFNVLIGVDRFIEGTTTTDYAIKAPNPTIFLNPGQFIYVDFAPMDPKTGDWGDWSSTCVFRPQAKKGIQQIEFLNKVRNIQLEGINQITAKTTGADIAKYYLEQFKQNNIKLLDVRNNVGHSIHSGPKIKANRTWLDLENSKPLGPGIFTIEPGGISKDGNNVARFEECIYIPKTGKATIIGPTKLVPISFL